MQVKEYLANPDAFASAAPVEEAAPVAAAAVEEKEEEKEEESDEDMVCVPSVIPVCTRSRLIPIYRASVYSIKWFSGVPHRVSERIVVLY